MNPPCSCSEWIGDLARAHTRRLAAVARHEGLGGDDALDAVQDGFRTLLDRPDAASLRERPDDAARVLTAIVRNAARNLRRRRHRALPHRELDDADLVDVRRPDEVLVGAATSAQLGGCLAGLPEVHRQVVALRVLEEVSGADAARALGLTPGHVAVLLHRARKQLEACMQATDDGATA
ncbi:MAG TPA: sigma-70 family RNA polymerase sigma factor [Kofleriaceae bacterium]|nr:sigma-70 family RNA polymerase sigma factor [Kofleriaceae bacterium]